MVFEGYKKLNSGLYVSEHTYNGKKEQEGEKRKMCFMPFIYKACEFSQIEDIIGNAVGKVLTLNELGTISGDEMNSLEALLDGTYDFNPDFVRRILDDSNYLKKIHTYFGEQFENEWLVEGEEYLEMRFGHLKEDEVVPYINPFDLPDSFDSKWMAAIWLEGGGIPNFGRVMNLIEDKVSYSRLLVVNDKDYSKKEVSQKLKDTYKIIDDLPCLNDDFALYTAFDIMDKIINEEEHDMSLKVAHNEIISGETVQGEVIVYH